MDNVNLNTMSDADFENLDYSATVAKLGSTPVELQNNGGEPIIENQEEKTGEEEKSLKVDKSEDKSLGINLDLSGILDNDENKENPLEEKQEEKKPDLEDKSKEGDKENDLKTGQDQDQDKSGSEPDFKAFYEKLTKPFKANGREMQLDNPDDIIRLAQMGVNYSQKMERMKADMSIATALKDAGLADPNKISQMIDIMNGDKDAIGALLKAHKIDTIDFDEETGNNYKPDNKVPDNHQIHVRNVIEDIQSSEGGTDFIGSTLVTDFDDVSKQALYQYPDLMTQLFENKQSGAYDKIMSEVQRLITVRDPSISGMNTLDLYNAVGQRLFAPANGDNGSPNEQNTQNQQATKEPVARRIPTNESKQKQAEQRKKVAGTNSQDAGSTGNGTLPDLSKLTDEQIEKLAPQMRTMF